MLNSVIVYLVFTGSNRSVFEFSGLFFDEESALEFCSMLDACDPYNHSNQKIWKVESEQLFELPKIIEDVSKKINGVVK